MSSYASLHPARGKLKVEVQAVAGGDCLAPFLAVKLSDQVGGKMEIFLSDPDELRELGFVLRGALLGFAGDGWPPDKEAAE